MSSPNDTLVAAGSGQAIIDASGDEWTVAGGKVAFNGVPDALTASVIELAYVNGVLWQENATGRWWAKTGGPGSYDGWTSGPGTDNSTGTLASPVGPIALTWIGGGDNSASIPLDWSPSMLPVAGDTLAMSTTGTMNVAGNALAGDTLSLGEPAAPSEASSENINISGTSSFTAYVNNGVSATINIAANSKWVGDIQMGFAGPVVVQGRGIFDNTTSDINSPVTVDAAVIGRGLFNVTASHTTGDLVFVKSVGANQSIDVAGGQYGDNAAILQIDDPQGFHAFVTMGFGEVLLEGLKASSYSLINDLLTLYKGSRVVDVVRLSVGNAVIEGQPQPYSLSVSQLHGAIELFNGAPITGGTILPVHS